MNTVPHLPQNSKGVERTVLASQAEKEIFWIGFQGRAVLAIGMSCYFLWALDSVLAASNLSHRDVKLEGFLEYHPGHPDFHAPVR